MGDRDDMLTIDDDDGEDIEEIELSIDDFGNINDEPAEKPSDIRLALDNDCDLTRIMKMVLNDPALRDAYELGLSSHQVTISPYSPYSDEYYAMSAGYIMLTESAKILAELEQDQK